VFPIDSITEVELFPTSTATESHCSKCASDLGSPVHDLSRLPRSLRKHIDSGPIEPDVSNVTGMKQYARPKWAYFLAFSFSACAAALLLLAIVQPFVYGIHKTCPHLYVVSHTKNLPSGHGIVVTPSGRFPSDLYIYTEGSNLLETFAAAKSVNDVVLCFKLCSKRFLSARIKID
jgi:hypothetical protein